LAALLTVAIWLARPTREASWKAILRAADAQRWADVEAGLRHWLRQNPKDGNAWAMLGGLLFDRGREHEALSALRRVREVDDGWLHSQTLIGEIAIRQHRIAEAERIFAGAAQSNRPAIEPLRRLVYILSLERRPAEARSVLWRLYRITRDPRHLADCCRISLGEEDERDSSSEIGEYLRQTPDDPWLGRAWGLFLLAQGQPSQALPHLEAAALDFENDPIGRFALAECRMALGFAVDDLSILGTRPSSALESARWWVLLSRLEEVWGKADDALESLRKAISADPENHEALYRLGRTLMRRGEPEEARAQLDRAEVLVTRKGKLRIELANLQAEGFDANRLDRLGHLCLEAGMRLEARAWFELSIQHDPRRSRLSSTLAQQGDTTDVAPAALSWPVLKSSTHKRSPARPLQTVTSRDPGPRFEDIADRSGVRFRYDCGATGNFFLGDIMGGGVALFDFDDDGWLDIYFVNGCPLPVEPQRPPQPNKLYRNRGDGTFEDVTERAGVAGRGYGMGCAVGDFDNDGHDDLFVTGLSSTVLYRNRGDGTFEDVTDRAGVSSSRWTTAAGFGDLDGDGDLDLVAVTYVEADSQIVPDCRDESGKSMHCSPTRFAAQLDHLFRNNGNGSFTDVSREAGIEIPGGRGLGLAIADFDSDGRLDLFVANDASPNFLFRNLGGLRFEEVGVTAGAAYDGAGQSTASMGVVADDLNGDGRIDLFHTNFINQTNTLRWGQGGMLFVDGTLAANLAAPSRSKTGFGAVAFDADNDGRLDLFVANGHTDDQPWFNTPMALTAQLYLGREHGRFEVMGSEISPYFSRPVVGRGVAAGDLDNDGRVDLVVVHRDAPAVLLRNCTRSGHFLGLRLRGTRSGRSPVGVRVTCGAGGRTWVRWLTSGTSYLSSNDPRLWFGLGSIKVMESLEVRWPSGTVQRWSDVAADGILDLREGENPVRQQRFERSYSQSP
jgi:tetratricopeptide (TPR) repeat protein